MRPTDIWRHITVGALWLWGWALPVLRIFKPGPRAQRAAWLGGLTGVSVFLGFCGVWMLRYGYGVLFDGLLGLLIGLTMAGLGGLVMWLFLAILSRLPRPLTPMLIASVMTAAMLAGSQLQTGLLIAAAIVLAPAVLAAGLAGFGLFKESSRLRRAGVAIMVLLGAGGLTGFLVWFLHTGTTEGLVTVADALHEPVPTLALPDPGEHGPMTVRTLTYGSGNDWRPEFGEKADLTAHSVDGSPFVDELEGFWAGFRHRYWGFEAEQWPLQGRVWYPEGDGPFPLVLIVHGNHSMREQSDPGYAYLGELIASRGMILVSVDENFLNGDWSKSYRRENDARGWLLLEHLKQWREWNAAPEGPFAGKVDMEQIGLIGHSRGGEAVAVAAAFNRLSHYPDDATIEFDFGFAIRGVVAIAPIDGQYEPAGQSTPLSGVSYLVLHGSHDADVSIFSGDRLYKRIRVSPGDQTFKTSIYVYRANHGQFNTVWGSHDRGKPFGYLLNTAALLSGEEQRRAGRVYISGFLEATLHGDSRYLELFRDYRAGSHWLPDTYFVNRFSDGAERLLADYDEDIDVSTLTLSGGTAHSEELATWREGDLGYRSGSWKRQNQVVFVGWRPAEPHDGEADSAEPVSPTYAVRFPEPVAATSILFSAAQVDEKPKKPEEDEDDEGGEDDATVEEESDEDSDTPAEPLDFSIEIEDEEGRTAAVALSRFRRLMPPLKARFTRFGPAEERYGKSSEPVLQTIELPMALLEAVNPELDPTTVRWIRFRFDRSPEGVIALDEIGYRPRPGE